MELSTRSINVLKKRLKLKQLRELESIDYEHDERIPKSNSYSYLNLSEKSVKNPSFLRRKLSSCVKEFSHALNVLWNFLPLIDRREYLGYLVTNKKSRAAFDCMGLFIYVST